LRSSSLIPGVVGNELRNAPYNRFECSMSAPGRPDTPLFRVRLMDLIIAPLHMHLRREFDATSLSSSAVIPPIPNMIIWPSPRLPWLRLLFSIPPADISAQKSEGPHIDPLFHGLSAHQHLIAVSQIYSTPPASVLWKGRGLLP
jgi:hypothetical protein